jgi:predicted nucleic acid-binding protein
MTTAVDTNVIVALWNRDVNLSSATQSALDAALARGGLVISAPVFAELMACPGRSEDFLESFFNDTGMAVDWILDHSTWRAAGQAFQTYASRRKRHIGSVPRRILADFVIGAHALQGGYQLLTLDDRLYRAAFPKLIIVGF